MEIVTILTPTYNRESELKRLFSSICAQTDMRLKWMIVDDGSTDGTETAVVDFQQRAAFSIQYIKKENGGKHTALNRGFQEVDTELTFIVDSDDILTENAIEAICECRERIFTQNLAGVAFLRGYTKDECIGDPFPQSNCIMNDISVRLRMGIRGDKAEVWRSDILSEYRFPEFSGENFQGENYIWWQIARKYDMLYINQIIYITEYLEGGLTKSGRTLRLKNPLGGMQNSMQAFHPEFPLKTQFKCALLYDVYGYAAGWSVSRIVAESGKTALTSICALPALLLYFYWKTKYLKTNR